MQARAMTLRKKAFWIGVRSEAQVHTSEQSYYVCHGMEKVKCCKVVLDCLSVPIRALRRY